VSGENVGAVVEHIKATVSKDYVTKILVADSPVLKNK